MSVLKHRCLCMYEAYGEVAWSISLDRSPPFVSRGRPKFATSSQVRPGCLEVLPQLRALDGPVTETTTGRVRSEFTGFGESRPSGFRAYRCYRGLEVLATLDAVSGVGVLEFMVRVGAPHHGQARKPQIFNHPSTLGFRMLGASAPDTLRRKWLKGPTPGSISARSAGETREQD